MKALRQNKVCRDCKYCNRADFTSVTLQRVNWGINRGDKSGNTVHRISHTLAAGQKYTGKYRWRL